MILLYSIRYVVQVILNNGVDIWQVHEEAQISHTKCVTAVTNFAIASWLSIAWFACCREGTVF